jgi:hypothetical protein
VEGDTKFSGPTRCMCKLPIKKQLRTFSPQLDLILTTFVIGNVIVFHHSALQFSQSGVLMILAMERTYFWCKKKKKD